MNFAMIWIETLAAALLLVATTTACVARWRFRWLRLSGLLGVTLPLFVLSAALTWGSGYLNFHGRFVPNWFGPTLTWTLIFVVGALMFSVYGLGRAGDDPAPRAVSWPRGALALGFLAALVLLYITYTNLDLAMRMEQASLRAEASAKLLALSPPRVPDAENAALVYQEAFDNLTPRQQLPPAWKNKADDWFDHPKKPIDPTDKDLLDYLASQERALTLLHKAAALPRCSFDRAYSENISLPLPEMEKLHRAADLLSLHAVVRASAGDLRTALSDLEALFGVARHANEPLLICVLNSLRIEELGVQTLEEVLALGTPQPALLDFLRAEPSSHRRDVVYGMQMEEAALGLPIFGLLGEDPDLTGAAPEVFGNSPPWTDVSVSLWRVFHMPEDLAAYRRSMTRMRHLAERPYYEAHEDWQKLEKEMGNRREGVVTSLLLPAMWKCVVRAAEADAHRRLARLAVAAVLYKAKNGKYPKKMDDLTPAFLPQPLLDPFDGKLLGLRADGDGLILSSRPDTPWHRKDLGKGEIVFRLK